MLASRLRRLAAAVLFSAVAAGSAGACGGAKFTLVEDAGGGDDASIDDATAPQDSSVADGGDTSFCAVHLGHLLCDDFDPPRNVNDPKGSWDTFSTSAATDGVLSPTSFSSPPRSFLASTTKPSLNGTTLEAALLTKDLNHAKTVILQFDVMVEAYGGTGATAGVLVHIEFGQLAYDVLAFSPTSLVFLETLSALDGGANQSASHPASTGLPTGVWTHVAMTLTLPQSAAMRGSLSIALGNGMAGTIPLTYFTTGALPGGGVAFGLLVTTASTIWKVRYDNIIIDKLT